MTKGKKTRLFDQRDENNLTLITLAFGSVEAGSGRQDLLATEADRIVLFVTNGGQSHKADETTSRTWIRWLACLVGYEPDALSLSVPCPLLRGRASGPGGDRSRG